MWALEARYEALVLLLEAQFEARVSEEAVERATVAVARLCLPEAEWGGEALHKVVTQVLGMRSIVRVRAIVRQNR